MIFDPSTRSRTRTLFRLLWPPLIVVAIIIAIVVASAGDDTRAELSYLQKVQSQSVEFAKDGDALRVVVDRLDEIDRTEFDTVIDTIQADLDIAREFVDGEAPTDRMAAVRALYRQTLLAWETGIAEFQAAVLGAADDPDNLVAIDRMAEALATMRAGDGIHLDLVAEIESEELIEALVPMSTVVLAPGDGSLVRLSAGWVDAARSTENGLALRPGLAVSQVVSEPLWQINLSDQAVIPVTNSVVFSVVVTNTGNVISGGERLILTLTGGPDQIQSQQEINPLPPAQQVTIVFDAFDVEPGGIYEVAAMLEVVEDIDFTDNEIRVQFSINDG